MNRLLTTLVVVALIVLLLVADSATAQFCAPCAPQPACFGGYGSRVAQRPYCPTCPQPIWQAPQQPGYQSPYMPVPFAPPGLCPCPPDACPGGVCPQPPDGVDDQRRVIYLPYIQPATTQPRR